MRFTFQPIFVGDPFNDPSLYVEIMGEKDALLFDLGRNDHFPSGKLVKVSSIFVSHTHMDHFMGFDHLLYIFHGREKEIKIFGPKNIIKNVKGKLSAYTWNLVDDYKFSIKVFEIRKKSIRSSAFVCKEGFREKKESTYPFKNPILETDLYMVSCAILDHKIPCLGFSLKEKLKVNINKTKLDEMGLLVGPWLKDLKRAALRGDFNTTFYVKDTSGNLRELNVSDLKDVLIFKEGQKISYIVDVGFTKKNVEKIVELVKDSDILYCEATFLEEERAACRYHLTAYQAGEIASMANVKKLCIFHFSPKYRGRTEELIKAAKSRFFGEVVIPRKTWS